MKKYYRSPRAQRGNVLLFLVGGLLLAGLLGAAIMSFKGSNNSLVSNATANGYATELRGEFDSIETYVGVAASVKGVSPTLVTLNNNASTGLFHPDVGGGTPQTPTASAMADTTTTFVVANVVMPNLGTAAPDRLVLLGGVSQSVCLATMQTLRGSAAVIPSAGITAAVLLAGSADLTSATGVTGKALTTGCVTTSDASPRFVAYRVINAA